MAAFPYVSPEQLMSDKAEYARKGIARSKDVVAIEYQNGIMFITQNTSPSLRKTFEIYDRIAIAGVGNYQEFETIRRRGIEYVETKGFYYSREDVTAKDLATYYAQAIGGIWIQTDVKPIEVDLILAEVDETPSSKNSIYRVSFDGSLFDRTGFATMGGHDSELTEFLEREYKPNLELKEAVNLGFRTLLSVEVDKININSLEIAILDKNRQRRKFKRLSQEEITEFLS
jgi:proteasome alpha subunit